MNELLPCPFCGGAARLVNYNGIHYVDCDKCSIQPGNDSLSSKEVAVAAWNRRAPSPGYLAGIEAAAKWITEEVQRCTCPLTPGEIRKHHERWCPWGIVNAIRALATQAPGREMNQCDGCRRGLPLREGSPAPVHYNPDAAYDIIGCTASYYTQAPEVKP